jgi:hypothetical protein
VRQIRSAVPVVLAGVLLFAVAGCSSGSARRAQQQPSGTPTVLEADCLDLERGGQHLALDVVGGLHPLDPDKQALNADFSVGRGITVEQLAWVLLGARIEKEADGEIFVWATKRTSRFPAVEAMRRTIFESSGTSTKVKDLEVARTRVAGLPAESAVLTTENGSYDVWTFTSGTTRFIVYAHHLPRAGAFELARVPDLLSSGSCPQA